MFIFKIKNTLISADIGFLSVIALISLCGGKNCGYAFAACIIHEAGHLIQMLITSDSIKSVSFTACGIRIKPYKSGIKSISGEISVLLAGPFANFAVALFMLLINGGRYNIFIVINIITGIFNLLPFSELDGGSCFRCAIEYFVSSEMQNFFYYAISIFNIVLCIISDIFLISYGIKNISAWIMTSYLILSEISVRKKTL